jgi:hypothetical protein
MGKEQTFLVNVFVPPPPIHGNMYFLPLKNTHYTVSTPTGVIMYRLRISLCERTWRQPKKDRESLKRGFGRNSKTEYQK